MIHLISSTTSFGETYSGLPLIVVFVLALLTPIVLHVFRGIGLYTMANKQKMKFAWIAFLPCAWVYVASKLLGVGKFFGVKKFALLFLLVFTFSQMLTLAYQVILFLPIASHLIQGGEVFVKLDGAPALTDAITTYLVGSHTIGLPVFTDSIYICVEKSFIAYGNNFYTMGTVLDILYYVQWATGIAVTIIEVSIYFSLFRRYWPERYLLASLLSTFLGLFPIFVFIVRKNQPKNYAEFLRERYNERMKNNPYGPYGAYGPFGPQGPTQNPYQNNNNSQQSENDPFKEYQQKKPTDPGDPFAEFNSDDK